MATQYDTLPVDDEYNEEEELDFSDLREQFNVRLEEGFDAFVVLDGLPLADESNKGKLMKFITKKLSAVGRVREDGFHMPTNEESGKTEG